MRIPLRNEHLVAWSVIAVAGLLFFIIRGPDLVPVYAEEEQPRDSVKISGTIIQADSIWMVELDIPVLPPAPTVYIFATERPYHEVDQPKTLGQLGTPGSKRYTLPAGAVRWEQVHLSVVDLLRDSVYYNVTIVR